MFNKKLLFLFSNFVTQILRFFFLKKDRRGYGMQNIALTISLPHDTKNLVKTTPYDIIVRKVPTQNENC